jgi:hypothetical protein
MLSITRTVANDAISVALDDGEKAPMIRLTADYV